MRPLAILLSLIASLLTSSSATVSGPPAPIPGRARSLFDGSTLDGWEGDPKLWRVQDGCLTGGSLTETLNHNDFLASRADYTNFVIRFQIKLTGGGGFINSGFQIRSQRVPNNSEMAGYQCDFGEPTWYGAIYDESRRNRVLSESDMRSLRPVLKPDGWNDYVILADGPRIVTWINGVMGTDYVETDPSIPGWGKFGIQVHAGGKPQVQVRNVQIEELPRVAPGKVFQGAPTPPKTAKASPLLPEEEKATFTLPPGFEVELVASEDMTAGFGKFVAVDWDLHGNLWTMTALEYPVDANENPEVARALYASKAKDKVLVYDRDPSSPTGYASKPRVFAEGLAIPLGILPYGDGVYVQHGTEIVFLRDTDGDGKADKREVVLSGFGVQDSHLFPHQFSRAPGNWIWMAQGAFNYSKVRTSTGKEQQFDQTRMAKFRYDGSDFDITSQGPCNIWGFVLDGNGQAWIQEANDFGYPMMPFHEYANYPGCSAAQWKSYAPEFPSPAPDFEMGGTGLSGLALTDGATWPEAYANTFYVANPITRKIQAIRVTPKAAGFRYQKLPDFILSSDEWFRPVALRLGPDGCLYFVDWYNKVISHNEVPRNHPERDKKRGRIWRVKHQEQKPYTIPDFFKLTGEELLAKLGGESIPQSHMAWQAITDRKLVDLIPTLKRAVEDQSNRISRRIASLWALEGLRAADAATVTALFTDPDRNVRREALRAFSEHGLGSVRAFETLASDPDPEVRSQVVRSAGVQLKRAAASDGSGNSGEAMAAVQAMLRLAQPALSEPTTRSTQSGAIIKAGEAYEREFERYLVRLHLEPFSSVVTAFLDSSAASSQPVESLLLASLALDPKVGAVRVAKLLPEISRPPAREEVLRLAQHLDQPGVGAALNRVLEAPATSVVTLETLLAFRNQLPTEKLTPILTQSASALLAGNTPESKELGARLASRFQLVATESKLIEVLREGWRGESDIKAASYSLSKPSLAALDALHELKSDQTELFTRLAEKGDLAVQESAIRALAASKSPSGAQALVTLYPQLALQPRRTALPLMTASRPGAAALVKAVRSGVIAKEDLDGASFERLHAVLGEDAELAALTDEMAAFFRPALRLDGTDPAWVDSDITLTGAFTVETWVKLDPGIDNNDGLLGAPDLLDLNFFGSTFRVWVGGGVHDAIVAKKRISPDVWQHIALTRDATGRFRIYQNAELDNDQGQLVPKTFEHLRIGWTGPGKGTAGWLSEFRVWDRERTAVEIRNDFDRTFDPQNKPSGLVVYHPGAGPWGKLMSGAKVVKTTDFPPLLSPAEAKAMAEKFSHFRSLAEHSGDMGRGQALFKTVCMTCHSVKGQGGQVGPVLNGAGASGVEALLRNVITPNAAMEAGYRMFRVELKDGDVLDGIRVSEDRESIVLRRPNTEDLRVPQTNIKRAGFTRMSMMPEGLLDGLKPDEVSDLFAYLKTLK